MIGGVNSVYSFFFERDLVCYMIDTWGTDTYILYFLINFYCKAVGGGRRKGREGGGLCMVFVCSRGDIMQIT